MLENKRNLYRIISSFSHQFNHIVKEHTTISKRDALDYHSTGRPGKKEVISTKPCVTQKDLSLAYTPGAADPCLEIEKNPDDAYTYTAKGNLVAAVSNGRCSGPGQHRRTRRQARQVREGVQRPEAVRSARSHMGSPRGGNQRRSEAHQGLQRIPRSAGSTAGEEREMTRHWSTGSRPA
jgi:hypothetical protein